MTNPINQLEIIYPVGCIYTTFNPENPKLIFKFGEWEPINDVFLFCSNHKTKAKQYGGSRTHKLTINEMPKHKHNNDLNYVLTYKTLDLDDDDWSDTRIKNKKDDIRAEAVKTYGFCPSDNKIVYKETEEEGNDEEFSIMPPYLTCYAWSRIK